MMKYTNNSRFFVLAFASLSLLCQARAVSTIEGEYKSLTVSNSTVVALGSQNDLFTSDDDGVTFTLRETTSDTYNDVSAFGSTVIAVGVDGLALRSSDAGLTWASIIPSDFIFNSLFATAGRADGSNPNKWIAVGDDGLDGAIYSSADDGVNWSLETSITEVSFRDVIWTGNRWLACGSDAFGFEGVVYHSTDGATWMKSTVLVPPEEVLLAIASDGAGNAIAVGQQGRILRSTDDGLNWEIIAADQFAGGDFNAVIADSSGTFFAGGVDRLVEINGTSVSTLASGEAITTPIVDFILIDDVPAALGGITAPAVRTIPLALLISVGGTRDYVLTVEETLIGKTYQLQTTTDLTADDWAPTADASVSGTGGAITFDVSENEPRRFWRVSEL